MNIESIPKIYDLIYSGQTTNGKLPEAWNKDAFLNSLRIWMASFSGETMHNPSKGGFLIKYLMKPMTSVDMEIMREAIRTGLTSDFTPRIFINYINVIPHYEQRYWEIEVSVYSPDLKEQIVLNERMKAQS